ncbi:hypothetical protein D3C78_1484790 [compost metagenome]
MSGVDAFDFKAQIGGLGFGPFGSLLCDAFRLSHLLQLLVQMFGVAAGCLENFRIETQLVLHIIDLGFGPLYSLLCGLPGGALLL